MKILSSLTSFVTTMRMTRFRVQNYKKINDSGWITCEDLTAFVGKNEAGKSALFRGLSKLNPSDGEAYDGLKEFPRRRYSTDFKSQDWIVSTAEFTLDEGEVDELEAITPTLEGVTRLSVSRSYSGKFHIQFRGATSIQSISTQSMIESLRRWSDVVQNAIAPEGKGDRMKAIKEAINPIITKKIAELSANTTPQEVIEGQISDVFKVILSNCNESWEREALNPIITEIESLKKTFQNRIQFQKAEEWVTKNMPKFLYFNRYDVIDSAVDIAKFVSELKANPQNARLRTTRCLFQHVGLDLQRIRELDPSQSDKNEKELRRMADERHVLVSSASTAMTEKFANWWEQRKHKFRYQLDAKQFRVWVSDDLDPSEVELDQRSAGLQYFFSFYLIFLEEVKDSYQNTIILLDEPGLHYHGTAQQKAVEFLEKLSKQNQILYTTHSPFMINGDHLERVRIVYEDEADDGSTRVSDNVWPKDKDALFPLQAGLGYAVAQTLFYAGKQLVVEGLTDYSLLKAINGLLSAKGRTTLLKDAVIVPAGGIRNLMPLASILMANKTKLAILLDGDQAGQSKAKEVKKELLMDCLSVSDFTEKKDASIEDLFPEDLYLAAVQEAYPSVRLVFNSDESKILCISKRVDSLFKRTGMEFEKWKPVNILVDWILNSNPKHPIPDNTLLKFEAIFKEVNKIIGE